MMCAAVRGDDPFAALDSCLTALPDAQRAGYAPVLDASWDPSQPSPHNGTVWGCLAQAVWAVRNTESFEDAVVAAIDLGNDTDTVACVTGALAGAVYGIQAVPSRWATYVNGSIESPVGLLEYDVEDLQQFARVLLGQPARDETPLESPAGPEEVAPSLHAADLGGAARAPRDWAVVSLCRTSGRFDRHQVRRQVYLVDEPMFEENISLIDAVSDAVDAVDALLAAGHNVVVHCHGGRSRTGLVLKAWAMRRYGYDEREAHDWLSSQWFRYRDYNDTFVEFLRSEWPVG
jgi:ADP-ribosyl-[dinitrogen reductase] hydrolase